MWFTLMILDDLSLFTELSKEKKKKKKKNQIISHFPIYLIIYIPLYGLGHDLKDECFTIIFFIEFSRLLL